MVTSTETLVRGTVEFIAFVLSGTVLDATACERAVWFLASHPAVPCVTGASATPSATSAMLAAALQFVVMRMSVAQRLLDAGDQLQAATAIALIIGSRRESGRGAGWVSDPLIRANADPAILVRIEAEAHVALQACIELSGVLVMERERIEKLVNTIAEDQQVEFKIFEVTETTIILGLETEIALMDVVRSIWVSTAPFKPDKPIQIGLHVAPVQIKKIEADINIKSLKAISQFATIGSICSTMGFASVLALHPRKFQLDYIGVIQLPDQNENSSLYRVKFSP